MVHVTSTPSQLQLSLPQFTHLSISLIVSDLSSRGAGRWGGAVRPFLIAQALQRLGCQVKLVGFHWEEGAAVASTPELPVVVAAGKPYPQCLASARSLLPHLDGNILYAYK